MPTYIVKKLEKLCQNFKCQGCRNRGDSDIFLYTPLYFPKPKCKISQLSHMLFNLFYKPTYKLKYTYMEIYMQIQTFLSFATDIVSQKTFK